jgi:U4/U6.U5 tri-snRNP-associated protein 2
LILNDSLCLSTQVPFSLLTLDLPPAPLFKDEQEKNIIPQVRRSACKT